MLQFDNQQFIEFNAIADFLLIMQDGRVPKGKIIRQIAVGNLIGLGASVKNSLYKKGWRTISNASLEIFQSSFNLIRRKKQTTENRSEFDNVQERLSALQEAVIAKGDIDPKTLAQAAADNPDAIIPPVSDTRRLPRWLQDCFVESTWYCHEQGTTNTKRCALHFGRSAATSIEVTLERHGDGSIEVYTADFLYDENVLIVKPAELNRSRYSHYMFLLDNLVLDKELCFGQLTSKHDDPFRLATKTVLLQKNHDKVDDHMVKRGVELLQSTGQLLSPPNFILRMSDDFTLVRDMNTSSKPYVHKPLLGDWKVLYRLEPEDDDLTENDVQILQSGDTLRVLYTHHLTPNIPVTWEGTGYTNFQSHTLSVQLLEGLNDTYSPTSSRPTFMMVAIPEIAVTEIKALLAIITGSRDQNIGWASRMVLLVKIDNGRMSVDFNLDKVKSFFSHFKEGSRIELPRTRKIPVVYNLSHIEALTKNNTAH